MDGGRARVISRRMRRIVEWNGRDVPAALRDLPPGRYVVEDEPAPSDADQQELRRLAARVEDTRCCD